MLSGDNSSQLAANQPVEQRQSVPRRRRRRRNLRWRTHKPSYDKMFKGSDRNSLARASASAAVAAATAAATAAQRAGVPAAAADVQRPERLERLLRAAVPSPWMFRVSDDRVQCLLPSPLDNCGIQRSITVRAAGETSFFVHMRPVPREHDVYSHDRFPAFLESADEDLVSAVEGLVAWFARYSVCHGQRQYEELWCKSQNGVVDENLFGETTYGRTLRSRDCNLLVLLCHGILSCKSCKQLGAALRRLSSKMNDNIQPDVVGKTLEERHECVPNRLLNKSRLLRKLKEVKVEADKGKRSLQHLRERIGQLLVKKGVVLRKDVSQDLLAVLNSTELGDTQKLFLEQQVKTVTVKGANGMRWHPQMIRLALFIHLTSPSAYRAIQDSGFIRLPSTLYDYTHLCKTMDGCNPALLKRTVERLGSLESHQKYVVLSFDEMYVYQDLVFDRHTRELVGYVNLDTVQEGIAAMERAVQEDGADDSPPVASKMLAYMVKGITSDLRCVVASYTVATLKADDLFKKTWDTVGHLEKAGLKVLVFTCDGSNVNRKFFDIHAPLNSTSITYKTANLRSVERRDVYFIVDPPHLMETVRNAFSATGAHSCSRLLTKNGEAISWDVIEHLYRKSSNFTLTLCPKLTAKHVYLDSFSRMNVRYAAQVLSDTVAAAVEMTFPERKETVLFIRNFNKFFDCVNGANTHQGVKKRNDNLLPYRTVDDERFDWLQDTFLQYLRDWEVEAKQKYPELGQSDSTLLLLPRQTLEGIEITIKSLVEIVRFMLTTAGARLINPRVLCLDYLEQYFGRQRSRDGGQNNPTVKAFRQNDVNILLKGDVAPGKKRGANTEGTLDANVVGGGPALKRARRKEAYPLVQDANDSAQET